MNFFTQEELACKCGKCKGFDVVDKKLLFMINMTRFYVTGLDLFKVFDGVLNSFLFVLRV